MSNLPLTGDAATDANIRRAAALWAHFNEPQPVWETRTRLGPDHFPNRGE